MKIYNSIREIPSVQKGIITIGTFDGLHIGHRKIIQQLKEDKQRDGDETFLLTFSNHPFEVLSPGRHPQKLATLDFKINFLKKNEIDHLVLIKFTKEIAQMTHHHFFDLLLNHFGLLKMVLGDNFRFGKDNKGNIDFLRRLEDKKRFFLDVITPIYSKNLKVSSSQIRQFIQDGEIELANEMLEREYFIEGITLSGDQIGKKIGFPTINMINKELIYPINGVYKTQTEVDNQLYSSMTFIGKKSVGDVQKKDKVIETHIFNFNREIYNQKVCVYFQKRIRNEMQFNSLDELKAQLVIDKQFALSIKKVLNVN